MQDIGREGGLADLDGDDLPGLDDQGQLAKDELEDGEDADNQIAKDLFQCE